MKTFDEKPKFRVLIFVKNYLPGSKSGGPIRSIAALVQHLGSEFEFYVITRDRDGIDETPYEGICADSWVKVGNAWVYYSTPGSLTFRTICHLINQTGPDVIYLNSVFNYNFTHKVLWLRRFAIIPSLPIVLAPRGEFSSSALGLKAFKKKIFLRLTQLVGLFNRITWQASTLSEVEEIKANVGPWSKVFVARNLSEVKPIIRRDAPRKLPGILRIVYLSRITHMKNLLQGIQALSNLEGDIRLDIYGPIFRGEEGRYWEACLKEIDGLPPHIVVTYHGAIENSKVTSVLSNYHVMLLPTLGENFGHAILEALVSGCPVITSDRTPWNDLEEKHAGIVVSLEGNALEYAIDRFVKMDEEEFRSWSISATEYGINVVYDREAIDQNIKMLYGFVA